MRAQDVDLGGTNDEVILDWAAENHRVLLTYDRDTVPGLAYERVAQNRDMPGVIVLKDGDSFGDLVDEVLLIAFEMETDEIKDRVLFI